MECVDEEEAYADAIGRSSRTSSGWSSGGADLRMLGVVSLSPHPIEARSCWPIGGSSWALVEW